MTTPRPTVRRAGRIAGASTIRAAASLAALAAAGLVTSGCRPSVASQGQRRDVLAAYQLRTLEARLGPEVPVLTVRAAAEQALRSRGYVVEKTSGAADRSRVQARAAGQGDWDKVVVESWVGARFTGVSVTREPWGNEAESRAILDAILNRLGR